MEDEYIAGATGVSECIRVKDLLSELKLTADKEPLSLIVDNQAEIKNMENSVRSHRSKHINIRFHFVRDNVQAKRVTVHYCSTSEMLADILTKPLGRIKHERFTRALHVMSREEFKVIN